MTRLNWLILMTAICGLADCDAVDSHTARQAQKEMVGMQRADVYGCAGLPNRSMPMGGALYETWDYQPFTPDQSLSATVPLIGGVGLGLGGTCHATAIFQGETLTAMNYSGDTGGMLGHVAECASIVSHCLDHAKEATGKF
jgi:hypothetical protein